MSQRFTGYHLTRFSREKRLRVGGPPPRGTISWLFKSVEEKGIVNVSDYAARKKLVSLKDFYSEGKKRPGGGKTRRC